MAPLFKKGEKYRASNYRPISLTSIVCKMLEHIIASNIMCHFEDHSVLYHLQHGFRRFRSCVTQLISLYDDLVSSRDRGVQTDLIIMDFAKAFDKVSHRLLATKLSHYGIRNNTLIWIKNFLSNRTQRVLVEGKQSASSPVTSGVRKGQCWAPFCFWPILMTSLIAPSTALFDCLRMIASSRVKSGRWRTVGSCNQTSPASVNGRRTG